MNRVKKAVLKKKVSGQRGIKISSIHSVRVLSGVPWRSFLIYYDLFYLKRCLQVFLRQSGVLHLYIR